MIKERTYILNANGQPRIYDAELAGGSVTVLSVKRENQRKYSSGGFSPSSSEYLHQATGMLVFNAGAGAVDERVTVIFKD